MGNDDDEIYRVFHDGVQCFVRTLHYDFKKRVGQLILEDGSCTDMSGCTGLFEKIDPNVQAIQTIAGGRKDTSYVVRHGKWHAVVASDPRPKSRSD